MNHKTLQAAVEKAEAFIDAARAVRIEKSAYGGDYLYLNGPRETGAAKRASMDLTRALADMRRAG